MPANLSRRIWFPAPIIRDFGADFQLLPRLRQAGLATAVAMAARKQVYRESDLGRGPHIRIWEVEQPVHSMAYRSRSVIRFSLPP